MKRHAPTPTGFAEAKSVPSAGRALPRDRLWQPVQSEKAGTAAPSRFGGEGSVLPAVAGAPVFWPPHPQQRLVRGPRTSRARACARLISGPASRRNIRWREVRFLRIVRAASMVSSSSPEKTMTRGAMEARSLWIER